MSIVQEGQYPWILGAIVKISMKAQDNCTAYNTAQDIEG